MKTLIKKKIEHFARKWADWLSNRVDQLPPMKKKTGLIVFCVLFAGTSFFIIVHTVLDYRHRSNAIVIVHTYPSLNIGKTYDRSLSKSFIPYDTYTRIESLKANDSLLQARPHLIDTILLIERLYRLQSKK